MFFAFCNLPRSLSGSKLMPLGRPGDPLGAHLNALELHLALLKHPFGPVWNLFGGLSWYLRFSCRSFGCFWSHLGCISTWFDILLGSAWTFCDLISLWSKKSAAWGGRLLWAFGDLKSKNCYLWDPKLFSSFLSHLVIWEAFHYHDSKESSFCFILI